MDYSCLGNVCLQNDPYKIITSDWIWREYQMGMLIVERGWENEKFLQYNSIFAMQRMMLRNSTLVSEKVTNLKQSLFLGQNLWLCEFSTAELLKFLSPLYTIELIKIFVLFFSACTFTLTERSGVITSPNYPHVYPRNTNCSWRIEGFFGDFMRINTTFIDLQQSRGCR